jgi:hypothetical protein
LFRRSFCASAGGVGMDSTCANEPRYFLPLHPTKTNSTPDAGKLFAVGMNLIDMEPGRRHLCPSSACMGRLYGSFSLSLRSSVSFLSPLTSFIDSSKQQSRHHSPSRPKFLILCAKAWSPRIKRTYRRWLLVERGGMEGLYREEWWSPHNINPDNWLSVIRIWGFGCWLL